MSSTSTSKFGMERPSDRKVEEFTSFSSSLNTEFETIPLKPGFQNADLEPFIINQRLNNALVQGGLKYRLPHNRELTANDFPDLIQNLIDEIHLLQASIQAMHTTNEQIKEEHQQIILEF